MANSTCCPIGFVYDPIKGTCLNSVTGQNTSTIDCTCCPIGYSYFSLTGVCVLDASPNSDPVEPIPCPCCPDGYTYVSASLPPSYPNGYCVGVSPNDILATIPCIPCDCAEPEPRECQDCQTNPALPISFVFRPNRKQCTDCDLPNEPRMTNDAGFNAFLPYFMIDPIINFKFK